MNAERNPVAFLFDVDNTLLDNDRGRHDLAEDIDRAVGSAVLGAVRGGQTRVRRPRLPARSRALHAAVRGRAGRPGPRRRVLAYPYRSAAFPGAHEVLRYVGTIARPGTLSDGDPVYQPAEIERAGIADEAAGRGFVVAAEEHHPDKIDRRLPAARYVRVDDQLRILAAAKERLGDRVITPHLCQGCHAHAAEHHTFAPADRSGDSIAGILDLDLTTFLENAR
ncbi:MAG TPA: hypothetical protein VNF73_16920 [Candidatus Saccharimonadales bacterium]|nr:hypothetical protein [Candidatus Saccharimonadales bacterium]